MGWMHFFRERKQSLAGCGLVMGLTVPSPAPPSLPCTQTSGNDPPQEGRGDFLEHRFQRAELHFSLLNIFSLLSAKINDLVSSTYKTIKTKLPSTLRSMSLYLSNKDTELILFKPVRVSIAAMFSCRCFMVISSA